jgi:hypothetical protein
MESFREVVKGDVTHMAILKDLEESFRKASKEDHEVWSSKEDQELETTKEELDRVLGGHWLGSTLVPFFSMPDKQDANSAGALALGERLRLSLGNGTPIHKQTVKYYQRAKKERGIQVNDSLLLEMVESFSAPQIHYQSKPIAGFVAQNSSEVAHGQVAVSSPTPSFSVGDVAAQRKDSNPMRGFLRRGFLIPSPKEKKESHSSSLVAVKDDDVEGGNSSALEEAFKFGWDQEDNDWDEEEDPYLAEVLRVMEVARPRAKGRRPRNKGKRELSNLESSVNYGIASASSRRRKGKISVS